ncbi:hypothetical protein ABIA39_008164 [Nocardia sp. GAS34]
MRQHLIDAGRLIVPGREQMHGPLPPLLLGLTLVTGLVDAFSYLELGHVLVANMTGNVVFAGFAAAHAPGFLWWALLLAVAAFLIGGGVDHDAGDRSALPRLVAGDPHHVPRHGLGSAECDCPRPGRPRPDHHGPNAHAHRHCGRQRGRGRNQQQAGPTSDSDRRHVRRRGDRLRTCRPRPRPGHARDRGVRSGRDRRLRTLRSPFHSKLDCQVVTHPRPGSLRSPVRFQSRGAP